MGGNNTVAFDALERIEIVRKDIMHDINVGLVTGAVKQEKKKEWNDFFQAGLSSYKKSNATDQSFLTLKAYLLSLLFNLTSGISLEDAWSMVKALSLPEELEKEVTNLAIVFSPRGKALYNYLIDLRRKETIRIAK